MDSLNKRMVHAVSKLNPFRDRRWQGGSWSHKASAFKLRLIACDGKAYLAIARYSGIGLSIPLDSCAAFLRCRLGIRRLRVL
jgi:hypothetical protein